jgi:L-ribulokinase
MDRNYVLGLDFGTESARALLVAVDTGEEISSAVAEYPDGVIDATLPGTGEKLPPDWALQNPADYLSTMEATVAKVLADSGVTGEDIIGVGVDFTACTVMPVDANNTPLCLKSEWKANKNAWTKLWKHHGAAAQAGKITKAARVHAPDLLARYGGTISSEWLFPKVLQVLEEAPEVYEAADRFIEAADWVVLLLTGEEKRNACCAGYKAMWDENGYPSKALLKAVNPRLENIVEEKLHAQVYPMGARAGSLTSEWAQKLGLKPGTAVATAAIDAHMGVPGTGVSKPGQMVMILGTSFCHMVCGTEKHYIEGVAGVVKDGILPGYFGYEAGQAAGGDIFGWFVKNCVPQTVIDAAQEGDSIHDYLSQHAGRLKVGESGLVCLDWWNGNRSVLVNPELSGLMVGMTLSTTAVDMYRAILESTAFGTCKIIQTLEAGGVPIEELYACGGLPNHNPLFMQILSDVTGREIKIADSEQTVALGAAMWGAVAAGSSAGGYDNIDQAVQKMARVKEQSYTPNRHNHEAYQKLYTIYERLHDLFGRGGETCMKQLKEIKREAGKLHQA